MVRSPRTPQTMLVRAAVRAALRESGLRRGELVLVALSGGADSLALAAATSAEVASLGVRSGAVIVDHGLQRGSAGVAARAAEQAAGLGLDPVEVRAVSVVDGSRGPEAAARDARYGAIVEVAAAHGAQAVLFAHTRDDQAEQVLLGLARGAGTRSIAGMPPVRDLGGVLALRPLVSEGVGVTRAQTEAVCAELGLDPWHDPHNSDRRYSRVRVRREVLPAFERELGPGVAASLARTADQAREDADALDALADELYSSLRAEPEGEATVGVAVGAVVVPVDALRRAPAALRNRVLRRLAADRFGQQLTREHTVAVASLVTAWKGQGPIHVPGIDVSRESGRLVFRPR